jgi:glucose/arabinose dehydrogenase
MTIEQQGWKLLAVLGAVGVLVSCGGGSGSGAGGSDTTPPSATLTAPANFTSAIAGTLTVTASATDNVGVASIEIQLDGTQVGTGSASPYSVQLDTTAYASGQHILRAQARDAAGNLSDWASATVQFGGSRTQPAGFTREAPLAIPSGNATAFAQAPAPDGRFFVAQQSGELRIVKNGVLLATPFMTLTVDSSGERGLIGVTLDPNFTNNGYVYVYYTTPVAGVHNRISRFTAIPPNADTVSVGSEMIIADLPALGATNHNGGALHFGGDGKLYVGVGDNANGANAQDLTTPLGKMLRLNVDNTLSIPADNPFCSTAATLKCGVWARGLRNPFTFAVHPTTGRIHINDVGEATWEEIDLGAAGANYGWNASEGPDNITAGVTAPIFTYKHSAANPAGSGPGGFFVGQVIAGGTFYPDTGAFPAAYRNSYYFSDYASKVIGRLDLANGNAAYAFGSVTGNPVDMLVGTDGALYVLTQTGIVKFTPP